jgi:hypothetical protein
MVSHDQEVKAPPPSPPPPTRSVAGSHIFLCSLIGPFRQIATIITIFLQAAGVLQHHLLRFNSLWEIESLNFLAHSYRTLSQEGAGLQYCIIVQKSLIFSHIINSKPKLDAFLNFHFACKMHTSLNSFSSYILKQTSRHY